MEAAFFAIDIVGIILLLYWSIMNDKLGPDSPTVGLFAYRETIKRLSPPAAEDRHSSAREREKARTGRRR